MYRARSLNKRENPESYRDTQSDPELQEAAASQFVELLTEMADTAESATGSIGRVPA